MKVKGILGVISEINSLKKKKVIKDYAIGGGIAKNYYLEPQATYDLDIFILIDAMENFHNIYSYFRQRKCKIENVFIVIKDVPVQFLPTFIHPLFEEAVKKSKKIKVNGVRTKILTAEYLIATLLISVREKDKFAIKELLSFADMDLLKRLLRKFDDKQYPIYARFKKIAEKR
ncbi:MAG: hypothetical protein J7J51_00305 [Candidatus Omnitrophica bacterium]|nr:hypothetical protein [Candidatus Omnitrophota bacterium]